MEIYMNKLINNTNILVIVITICFFKISYAQDEIIKGQAKAVNSDYIRIDKKTIILFGVEAMERPQLCYIGNEAWACWEAAVRKLEEIVDLGETVCVIKGESRMNRVFAICNTENIELNKELVRSGLALARTKQTDIYVEDEKYAKENKLGIWRGTFIEHLLFRVSGFVPDDP